MHAAKATVHMLQQRFLCKSWVQWVVCKSWVVVIKKVRWIFPKQLSPNKFYPGSNWEKSREREKERESVREARSRERSRERES